MIFDNRMPEKDIGHSRKKDEAVKVAYWGVQIFISRRLRLVYQI